MLHREGNRQLIPEDTVLTGPVGPRADGELSQPARPGLLPFLHNRVMGPNGVAAALYLALSAWIWRNPDRAARAWRRLQGEE